LLEQGGCEIFLPKFRADYNVIPSEYRYEMGFLDKAFAVPDEVADAYARKLGNKGKKPFHLTHAWKQAAGLNNRLHSPVLVGRGNLAATEGVDSGNIEPVIKFGGKRKLRKKG
jgi:hypothetical protein